MVLLGRIELPTSPLPRVRSTTELQQRRGRANHGARTGARYCRARRQCQADLQAKRADGKAFRMAEQSRNNLTREERLAARLRENLRRRKAQARALSGAESESPAQMLSKHADES